MTIFLLLTLLFVGILRSIAADPEIVVDAAKLDEPFEANVSCDFTCVDPFASTVLDTASSLNTCKRVVMDDFISPAEVHTLRKMIEKVVDASLPGPTIVDVDSGMKLPSGAHAVENIYDLQQHESLFDEEEYRVYRAVFERIVAHAKDEHNLTIYHTAPTFVASLVGDPTWVAQSAHDEYYHPHVDKENTPHYDLSTLVYLSTYGEDFEEGGEFEFIASTPKERPTTLRVLPRRGRLVSFTSGPENLHRVTQVRKGHRVTLSAWWTCDSSKRLSSFLDGKAHTLVVQRQTTDDQSEL